VSFEWRGIDVSEHIERVREKLSSRSSRGKKRVLDAVKKFVKGL